MTPPPSTQPRCPQCGSPLGLIAHGLCPRCVLAAGVETGAITHPATSPQRDRDPPPLPADLAAYFPQLEILEWIGRGGMGLVYKARQSNLDRLVALKILLPGVAGDPAFAERFQREARALARLNHPNIVTVYDFGQAGPYFYLVMEFVDGANLRQLERARRFSPEEAFAIVPRVCEALQYAHDEGIVHRDIKPENILIDGRGRLKIADFGIAKIVGQSDDLPLTGTRHALGTPQYMAPEQIESPGTVDHRADIYALGVVFYEMLTGELPLGRFEPPSSRVQVDVRMDDVVLKSLERNPERRYQTAQAVKTDVESIATATGHASVNGDGIPRPIPDPDCPIALEAAPAGGALSVLGRAWAEWWSGRADWIALSVQSVLIVVHLVCLVGFIGTRIQSQWQADGHRQFTYSLGSGDPWFTFETYPAPDTPFRSGMHAGSSLLFAVVGFAVFYVIWRIEKVRKPKAGFWSSPSAMAIVWVVMATVAIAMGTKMGFDALKEDSLGGLFAPQLRAALAIADTDDRDESLRRVAVQAANAKDTKTVHQAIQEISDSTAHDRTAADCALALAAFNDSDLDATRVAEKIRTTSLRDDTLSRLAAAVASPTAEAGRTPGREEQTEEQSRSPSLQAARAGDWKTYQLISQTVDSLRARDSDGRTAAMHFAVAGTADPFEEIKNSHLFGKAGPHNGFVGPMVAFDVDQLALADSSGKTALQLSREFGHSHITDTLWRHLETVIATETSAIDRITTVGLSAAELARASDTFPGPLSGNAAAQKLQLTSQILRRYFLSRSHAWQALGETKRATEDFERSTRLSEPDNASGH